MNRDRHYEMGDCPNYLGSSLCTVGCIAGVFTAHIIYLKQNVLCAAYRRLLTTAASCVLSSAASHLESRSLLHNCRCSPTKISDHGSTFGRRRIVCSQPTIHCNFLLVICLHTPDKGYLLSRRFICTKGRVLHVLSCGAIMSLTH